MPGGARLPGLHIDPDARQRTFAASGYL